MCSQWLTADKCTVSNANAKFLSTSTSNLHDTNVLSPPRLLTTSMNNSRLTSSSPSTYHSMVAPAYAYAGTSTGNYHNTSAVSSAHIGASICMSKLPDWSGFLGATNPRANTSSMLPETNVLSSVVDFNAARMQKHEETKASAGQRMRREKSAPRLQAYAPNRARGSIPAQRRKKAPKLSDVKGHPAGPTLSRPKSTTSTRSGATTEMSSLSNSERPPTSTMLGKSCSPTLTRPRTSAIPGINSSPSLTRPTSSTIPGIRMSSTLTRPLTSTIPGTNSSPTKTRPAISSMPGIKRSSTFTRLHANTNAYRPAPAGTRMSQRPAPKPLAPQIAAPKRSAWSFTSGNPGASGHNRGNKLPPKNKEERVTNNDADMPMSFQMHRQLFENIIKRYIVCGTTLERIRSAYDAAFFQQKKTLLSVEKEEENRGLRAEYANLQECAKQAHSNESRVALQISQTTEALNATQQELDLTLRDIAAHTTQTHSDTAHARPVPPGLRPKLPVLPPGDKVHAKPVPQGLRPKFPVQSHGYPMHENVYAPSPSLPQPASYGSPENEHASNDDDLDMTEMGVWASMDLPRPTPRTVERPSIVPALNMDVVDRQVPHSLRSASDIPSPATDTVRVSELLGSWHGDDVTDRDLSSIGDPATSSRVSENQID